MRSLVAKLLVGGGAGLLAWVLLEPTAPELASDPAFETFAARFTLVLGALVGLAVAGSDGYSSGSRYHTIRGMILGLVLGAVGAGLGGSLGGDLAQGIFGAGVFDVGRPFYIQFLARVIALTPIGLLVGAGIGAASLNWPKTLQGAIGGAIGGAVGAGVFDLIGSTLGATILAVRGQVEGEVGSASRAIYAIALGMGIGLFIGIVERAMRSAWVRQQLGRNEGREWAIYGNQAYIGRSETAQIPLFGDPNISPVHAVITKQGDYYAISDAGSQTGTFLNGQPVQQSALQPGDQIQVGGTILTFLMKRGKAPAYVPDAYAGRGYPVQPDPQQQFQPQGPQQAPYMPPGQTQAPAGVPVPNQPTVQVPAQLAPMQPQQGTQLGGYALVAVDGQLQGQRFEVAGSMDVGRDCPAIPIGFDTSASRRHANLAPVSDGLQITDHGSTNGTFVNGQRIQSMTAKRGDHVKIGSTTFRVE